MNSKNKTKTFEKNKEWKFIQRGAEAILIRKKKILIKRRLKKGYRIKFLDEKIRKTRTRSEAKLLEKTNKIIPSPKLIEINEKEKEIKIQYLAGKKLSDNIDNLQDNLEICKQIGQNIAKIHDENIIHGDLTTSNMIYDEKTKKVYFIDFGLGFFSNRIEDKAVDLHLIKQALEAKHFKNSEKFFESIIEGYKTSKNYDRVLNQLKKVEKRGRYKEQY